MFSSFTVGLAVIAPILVVTGITFVRSYRLICHPNQVIVVPGRKRKLAGGNEAEDRLIRGGRAFRIPVLEKPRRPSLESMPLDLTVTNAYSKDGIPLHLEATAEVRIAVAEPVAEGFLEKRMAELDGIAKHTLGRNLREILATSTPEEINEDRSTFTQRLIDAAGHDLAQLGLELSTLKIQNVSDEAGYLDPFPWPRLRVDQAGTREDFAPLAIGEDAVDNEPLWQTAYKRLQPLHDAEWT